MHSKERKLDFNGQTFYVGIDVHKKEWKVTILGSEYEHKSMSQPADSKVLSDYLHRSFPGGNYQAVYEAGFSGFSVCRELISLGVNCQVVHPMDVPTTHKEKQQKTDRIDSRKLARYLRDRCFEGIDIPLVEVEAWRALLRQRFRVVRDISRTKNRVKSLLYQFGISLPAHIKDSSSRNWSGPYLKWLERLEVEEKALRQVLDNYISIGKSLRKELLRINRQVRELSAREPLKEDVELLRTIPGVGVITAMTLLSELYDIKRFKTIDALCSYVGLIPRMHNSGDKEWTGQIVNRGRKQLKINLIEASWDAVRIDPAMMCCFNELTKRMNKNKAIIRIARKLLRRIRYMLIHKQAYQTGVMA